MSNFWSRHLHQFSEIANRIHGAADHTDITRTLWIPAASFSGVDVALGGRGTAPDRYFSLVLVDAALTGDGGTFLVPRDWVSGTTLIFRYHLAGTLNFGATSTIRLITDYLEVQDSQSLIGIGTSLQTDVDPGTSYLADDLFIWTDPTSFTPATAGDEMRFYIQRAGAAAADDYTGNVRVVGLQVDYTANQ